MALDTNFDFWNSPPKNGAYNNASYLLEAEANHLQRLDRVSVARLGENLTASWAERAGWKTVYQGLRRRGFELDLVIQNQKSVKIIEVKTLRETPTNSLLQLTSGWMNFRKTNALRRGALFLIHALTNADTPIDDISCDLVALNLNSSGIVLAYRWPNACELS